MAARPTRAGARGTKTLSADRFWSHKLVLNQWLIGLFGIDPLAEHKDGGRTVRPLQVLAKTLKSAREGLDSDNLHHFYKDLRAHWQPGTRLKPADLLRYEHNLVSHTLSINAGRERPIAWKYYQWLSLLFAELYLDGYFNRRDLLLAELNEYVDRFNRHWSEQGFATGIGPYTEDELNKVCLQNATGSGKTLLMHVNFLQMRHYAQRCAHRHALTRSLLIVPNEGLSAQHARELAASGIRAERLTIDGGDLLASTAGGLRQVDYTEITKLGEKDGPNLIATRNLGDTNLLLVDEGHRGMGGKEEEGWFRQRERLAEKGFVFEYSATFKEAVAAAKRPAIEQSYAKSILFDYSYRYFYEDGYGKDYRIYNLPRTVETLRFAYLTAGLLAFYQQLRLYDERRHALADYNLEKPLWVFVGSSVTKAGGSRDEKETVTDVAKILQFLSRFLAEPGDSRRVLAHLLAGDGAGLGLLDAEGHDIVAGAFYYLKGLTQGVADPADAIYADIRSRLFHAPGGGTLALARIKGNENEILLRAGSSDEPFGLINVGDAPGLVKHLEERPEATRHLRIEEAEFAEAMFGQVHESRSPVNLLIGSKRFIEGWDCWRVSSLGLMHVGKSEGAQIIQLFGRGVRLKGHGWSLKRSAFATPGRQPEFVALLETLNVFGIEADFMERFKRFLDEEDLPRNDRQFVESIPLNVTYDFGKRLKVLAPKRRADDGAEYDFRRDGRVPALGEIPDRLRERPVEADWYPRIAAIVAGGGSAALPAVREPARLTDVHLAFLDYDALYLRLEQYKRERGLGNLNIERARIRPLLADHGWYRLYAPPSQLRPDGFANVALWQEMAEDLLQGYLAAYYDDCKAAFYEPRLLLRPLAAGDGSLPDCDSYQLVVDSDQGLLIQHIRKLKSEIAARRDDPIEAGELSACLLGVHLYEPLLHAASGSRIKIAPVSLNESEFRFVRDLKTFVEDQAAALAADGRGIYLLRNESRGRGIGFFEAGSFYPDFLLWEVQGDRQRLLFVEPHGLKLEGPASKKIAFHLTIKDIERRLADPTVTLESWIVTPTRHADLGWGLDMEELERRHVLFMNDRPDTYVATLLSD